MELFGAFCRKMLTAFSRYLFSQKSSIVDSSSPLSSSSSSSEEICVHYASQIYKDFLQEEQQPGSASFPYDQQKMIDQHMGSQVLFRAVTITRDSENHKPQTRCTQDLSLRRTEPNVLIYLNEAVQW